MIDLTGWSIQELTHADFACDCGRRHTISIGEIVIEEDASAKIVEATRAYWDGRIFVVCDTHTYEVAGKEVIERLQTVCADVGSYVFGDKHLIPDAKTVGTLLIEASEQRCDLLVAVGSGTINDTTRYIASRLQIPYIIVGTAPSMDGYAGDSCPIVCRNNKETFPAVYPQTILADTKIMAQAPHIMLCAGFGDVIGKYIALADWELARREIGEYYCESIANLMRNAVQKCVSCLDGVAKRDTKAVAELVEALCLAGMTMGLAGVTRPASGSEHHLTHFCDIDAIVHGRDYPLHGVSVGVFAIVMARFYEMARNDGYTDIETPSADRIRQLLEVIDAPVHPREIGVDGRLFQDALLHAKDLRPRYAILKYAYEKGFLHQYVDRLVQEYYPEEFGK